LMGDSSKAIWDHIRQATDYLQSKGVGEPFASARVLMASVLGLPTSEMVLQRSRAVGPEESERFWAFIARRAEGEPVAYILGRCEFYSLEFEVSPNVLIPTPETEHVVEAAIDRAHELESPLLLDLGTGSGCIAISIAVHVERARVVATDISRQALVCAARNVERHGLSDRVWLVCADMVGCFGRAFDIVVCNPPYVSAGDTAGLSREVRKYQPTEALLSGETGLEFIGRMLREAHTALAPNGRLIFEIGMGQAEGACELATSAGWEIIDVRRDLADIERVIVAKRAQGGQTG